MYPNACTFAWQWFLRTRSFPLEYILHILNRLHRFSSDNIEFRCHPKQQNEILVLQNLLNFCNDVIVAGISPSITDSYWRSIVTGHEMCQPLTARTCALQGADVAALRSPASALEITYDETAEGHLSLHASVIVAVSKKRMRNSWMHFKNLPKCSLGPDKYRNSKSLHKCLQKSFSSYWCV